MANSNRFPTSRIVLIGVMAAMIVVVTFFRFPLLGSKIHFANAMCLLAGLLLGPVGGGLAAGIGLSSTMFCLADMIFCRRSSPLSLNLQWPGSAP